ncbi:MULTISPECIES: hypothetical protein [unclassified Haematobacter]|uniref:hypothetical protein n=1 Tax=unclassified Haematobacter TaxID=2640585 RepID=UPI0025C16701|nr:MULTISPECIES: hypothetical protein [unclassified Haematobacter]
MSAPHLRFRPADRLQIGARTYRLLTATPAALGFVNVKDPDDLKTFSHTEPVTRLTQPGTRLWAEEENPRPKGARLRATHRYISTMPAPQRTLLSGSSPTYKRVLRRAGNVGRAESSVLRFMPQIQALADRRASRGKRGAGALLPPERQPPSLRALPGWVREVDRAGGNPLALARKPGSGDQGNRIYPEVERIAAEQIDGIYLMLQQPPLARLVEAIGGRIEEENLQRAERGLPPLTPPSARSVRRKVALLDPFEVAVQRHGRDHAARKFGFYDRGLRSERIGERVEIDERNVDLLTAVDLVGVQGPDFGREGKDADHTALDGGRHRHRQPVILGFKLALAPGAGEAVAVLQLICQDRPRSLEPCELPCKGIIWLGANMRPDGLSAPLYSSAKPNRMDRSKANSGARGVPRRSKPRPPVSNRRRPAGALSSWRRHGKRGLSSSIGSVLCGLPSKNCRRWRL